MQEWVETQMLIESTIDAYRNGKIPPEYWELRDGGRMQSPKFNMEGAIQSLKDLQEARVYEIDGRIGRLFALTPNKPRIIQLPFPKVFLNMAIYYNKTLITGILVKKDNTYGDGDAIIQVMCKLVTKPIPNGMNLSQYIKKMSKEEKMEIGGYSIWLNHTTHLQIDGKPRGIETQMNKLLGGDVASLLRRIVMNFNDFLEHPEVKIVEHKRTNQAKREKRGKLPLPTSTTIVVKGELRIYVDSIMPKEGETESLDKCFEVAGHWRRFRHPRYTNKRGGKTFIHPYIKGLGNPEIKQRKIPLTKLKRVEAI